MDCLICYKVFNKEVEYRAEPPPNPEMCLNIICKLFNIPPSHPDVQKIFEDPLICRDCHRKLRVLDKVLKSTEYEIRENLMTSKEASEIEERMSKSSRDRVTLMRAIETGGAVSTSAAGSQTVDISVNPGPSQPPIVSRNGVDKEARICLKPLEITPGATGFKVRRVNQAGESGTNYTFAIREKELVNEESESSEEEFEDEPSEEESEDEHLKCRICSKILSSERNLKRHAVIHTNQHPFKCQHCSRQFNLKYQLRNHLGNKTPAKCSTCNKTFPTSGCLMQHDWKVHQRGRYARDQVKKNFTKLKNKRFKCHHCVKIVKEPYSHMMVHRPPKYPCPVEGCGKMFNFSCNRTVHVKIEHEGKRYKCRVAGCRKSLRSKDSLLRHAKVHSKNKGPRVGKK